MSEDDSIRLQKLIAHSGLASRREAERLIQNGLVTVNGEVVSELGSRVASTDQIFVDGRKLVVSSRLYLALNKPRGYVCSREANGRFPSFLDLLPSHLREVHHVGRLDVASEGLLFSTTDGALTQVVTHPRYQVPKYYLVTLQGEVRGDLRKLCETGARVEDEWLQFDELAVVQRERDLFSVKVRLHGGKNREIRRLLEHFGYLVRRLQRIGIGSVRLGAMKTGSWRHLSSKEVASLFCFKTD